GSCTLQPAYGCGAVFKIAPDGTETILYSFTKNNGANGAQPVASLTIDGAGNLYGTASGGGQYGYGTVFEITP
ncbi:MAG TPA: choice-of-anchor tandem repeat GloVer-containing protein, partial [Rhizomicrobium sp.]|nr:choice-of-anchor tandem repeat GloVer-containing protein [Rhizomicrobium sp.]